MGYIIVDVDNGFIEWSNELVVYVVELKINGLIFNLKNFLKKFYKNILEINNLLKFLEVKLFFIVLYFLMDFKIEM